MVGILRESAIDSPWEYKYKVMKLWFKNQSQSYYKSAKFRNGKKLIAKINKLIGKPYKKKWYKSFRALKRDYFSKTKELWISRVGNYHHKWWYKKEGRKVIKLINIEIRKIRSFKKK